MEVHNKIGSKERLLEMFKNVNKTTVDSTKEDKPLQKEGFNKWGQKITKSRLDEVFMGESFDNPAVKDTKYLDKDFNNAQLNQKPDDGTRYPVQGSPMKVNDPSLENLKGDDIPLGNKTFEANEEPIEVEPNPEDSEFGATGELTVGGEVDMGDDLEVGSGIDTEIPLPGAGEDEALEGGLADGAEPQEFDNEQILKGMEQEMVHSNDPKVALELTMDHLANEPNFYDQTDEMGVSAEDAVDALGNGAGEEIPSSEDDTAEDEILWGQVDTLGEPEADEIDDYSPRGFGEDSGMVYDKLSDNMSGEDISRMKNRQSIRADKFSQPPIDDEVPNGDDAMSHIDPNADIDDYSPRGFSEGETTQNMDVLKARREELLNGYFNLDPKEHNELFRIEKELGINQPEDVNDPNYQGYLKQDTYNKELGR